VLPLIALQRFSQYSLVSGTGDDGGTHCDYGGCDYSYSDYVYENDGLFSITYSERTYDYTAEWSGGVNGGSATIENHVQRNTGTYSINFYVFGI
jgi:hypothetical protein